MAEEIDYNKRSLLQNMFDPGAWRNLLEGVGQVVEPAGDVWSKIEDIGRKEQTKPPIEPARIERNITASDLMFKPNWTLISFGVLLLAVAYLLKQR
jgi:hypothetical protein